MYRANIIIFLSFSLALFPKFGRHNIINIRIRSFKIESQFSLTLSHHPNRIKSLTLGQHSLMYVKPFDSCSF